ncbi:MAG: homoserine kinase [Gemmatimonadaceae bacterium]
MSARATGELVTPRGVAADRVITARVPASTSNLGAGFDSVGMAIGRWLNVTARVRSGDRSVVIKRAGTLAALNCEYADDLIWRGFVAACVALRRTPPDGIELHATSDIPVARGLGSSAAAVVAGVLLANAAFDGDLDSEAIIDIAASLEGHPDNVAPSTLGGAVLSVRTAGHHYRSVGLVVHPSLRFVFIVPDFEVRTAVARAALPQQLPYETAVTAASRAAALVVGLQTADVKILSTALDDVLHVPFRRALVPGYDHVTTTAIAAGAIGATLSGSGSTIVAVTTVKAVNDVCKAALHAWRSIGIDADVFLTAAEGSGATTETV